MWILELIVHFNNSKYTEHYVAKLIGLNIFDPYYALGMLFRSIETGIDSIMDL